MNGQRKIIYFCLLCYNCFILLISIVSNLILIFFCIISISGISVRIYKQIVNALAFSKTYNL